MNKDFEEYVMKRCQIAEAENEDFINLEKTCNDELYVRTYAEEICYKKGFSDAIKLLSNM